MLDDFIRANRGEIHRRARAMAKARDPSALASEPQLAGVRSFLDQLIARLCGDERVSSDDIARSASAHGGAMLREGHSIDEVVRGYGDVCQVVTQLAVEQNVSITTSDFHRFNDCLDVAMVEASREYVYQRDRSASDHESERVGVLAHELRNQLSNATIAFDILARGSVGVGGSTGALLGRGLKGLRDTIDRALADVRSDAASAPRECVQVATLLRELELAAVADANAKKIRMVIEDVDADLKVFVVPQALLSAVWNLVQNAIKFTRTSGTVTVRAEEVGTRALIHVEDECGGLPGGDGDGLFRPFEQRGSDRTGLGLGLAISRRGVEANGGTLRVRDIARVGCVFSIDLPLANTPRSRPVLE